MPMMVADLFFRIRSGNISVEFVDFLLTDFDDIFSEYRGISRSALETRTTPNDPLVHIPPESVSRQCALF